MPQKGTKVTKGPAAPQKVQIYRVIVLCVSGPLW